MSNYLEPTPDLHKVAYIVSRFPTIAETFILYEILALEQLGLQIEIFSLIHQREKKIHPEAERLSVRAHYGNKISRALLAAQFYWLLSSPKGYLYAWWRAICGNSSSLGFLIRALVVVPQAAMFARQMQKHGVQYIHAHWATHPTFAAYVIQILTDLPYSFTAHADDIYVNRTMLDEKIRRARFVVTISEHNRQFLIQLYGSAIAEKIVVIHCGVDCNVFVSKAGRGQNQLFTIVCVARLDEKKGHEFLIEACAQLKTQKIPFQCLIIGEGKQRTQIEAQITRLDLTEEVKLLGQQTRDRVNEFMAQANVMVLPSITTKAGRKEGIPVALMEALATELPAISTASSGIPELIEDKQTGMLVPERDSQALAEALKHLYHNPELQQRLGVAGRVKVLREFDLYHNATRLRTLFFDYWTAPTNRPTLEIGGRAS